MKITLLSFLFFIYAFCVYSTELPTDVAVLRGLDKVTGRMSTFSIPVGQVGQFGKTFIVPEACYTHPPEESPENSVFLYVFEKSLKGENIELFKGWMFSSEPALSSMEDPVYDIWLIECKNDKALKTGKNEKKSAVTEIKEEKKVTVSPKEETPVPTVNSTTDLMPTQVEMEEL